MLLEMIGYSATAPGSGGAAAAAVTGDSLAVRQTVEQKPARLIGVWPRNQTTGYHQLTWPSGHDTTRGIRCGAIAAVTVNALALGYPAPIQLTETISAVIAGSGTAGDIENGFLGLLYEAVPGLNANLITSAQLAERVEKLVTVYATLATGTGGGWSGAEAINAESDLLQADRDYAVMGAYTSVACCGIGMRAPDWGNVRVACPGGITSGEIKPGFFTELSDWLGQPTIPVFNSNNRASLQIDALQDENGADPIVTINLALLRR